MTPRGFVLYDGPSAINGERVVVIMTTSTANQKTGPMPQVWYLVADAPPHVARREGLDVAICGGCPHRKGSCYVVLHRGPLAVYRAWKAGKYGTREEGLRWLDYMRPRFVRVGAYGDPLSAPSVVPEIAYAIEPHGGTVLGYTHRWQHPAAVRFQFWLMASADTPADGLRARSKGWRTYRVRTEGEPLQRGEKVCAHEENRTACNACGECDGDRSPGGAPRAASIVATVHGLKHIQKKFNAWRGGAA
jgi:hypothetical protein